MRHPNKTATIFLFLSILVLVSGGEAFCGWEIQKPAGDTNLNDIAFVDELHGWAVGDSSLILATVDGGETWVEQDCPVENISWDLVYPVTAEKVFCVDHTNTFTATGTMLLTENGGNNWTVLDTDVPRISLYFSMCFIDELNGWACYQPSKTWEGELCQIWRTRDGGHVWEKISDATSSWLPIFSIQFIDENNGWFSAGPNYKATSLTIYHTTDGGNTWEKTYTFENRAGSEKIFVVPPDTVWCGLNEGVLFRSTDGGYAWEEMSYDLSTGMSFGRFRPFPGTYSGSKGYAFRNYIHDAVGFICIDFDTREIIDLDPGPTSPDPPYHVAIAGETYWATTR